MECTHQQVTAKRTPFFLNHKLTNSDTIREGSHRVHHPLCTYLSPLLLDKNALHSDREVPLQPFRKIKYLGKEKLSTLPSKVVEGLATDWENRKSLENSECTHPPPFGIASLKMQRQSILPCFKNAHVRLHWSTMLLCHASSFLRV